MEPVITDLDALSNSVLDALEIGKLAEAEKLCERLFREYPEVHDGHHHMGTIREAQGRFQEAAEHYLKVLEIVRKDPSGYDEEIIRDFTEDRERALRKARG